jgi:hypothetical protein
MILLDTFLSLLVEVATSSMCDTVTNWSTLRGDWSKSVPFCKPTALRHKNNYCTKPIFNFPAKR